MAKPAEKVTLNCSSCGKDLMDIFITRPEINLKFRYKAHCPYCGSYSFEKELTGGIMYGGLGVFDEKSPTCDDIKTYTVIERVEDKEDLIEFFVKKV